MAGFGQAFGNPINDAFLTVAASTAGLITTIWSTLAPAAPMQLAPIRIQALPDESQRFERQPSPSATDSGAALDEVPDAVLLDNGSVTGEIQYRGASAYDNNVLLDGMNIVSGGPNWMDTPLHYTAGALVERVSVTRGIPSFANSIDHIGTTANAKKYDRGYCAVGRARDDSRGALRYRNRRSAPW